MARHRPMTLVAICLALTLATPVARPAEPDSKTRQYANGLSWELTAPPVFAVRDAYAVQARLISDPLYNGKELTLLSGALVVELRHSSGSFRTHLLFKSGSPQVQKLDAASRGITASLDLRETFGQLAPGPWVARFILREGRYQVQGHTDAAELVATYPFEVVATTKEAASRTTRPTTDVVLDVTPPASDKPAALATFTLTNRSDRPIVFLAYVSGFDRNRPVWVEPLSTTLEVERFVPPGSWQPSMAGYCGTGLNSYPLAPGKSVRLAPHPQHGAQFARFRLNWRVADDANAPWHSAVSPVVESPDPLETTPPAK